MLEKGDGEIKNVLALMQKNAFSSLKITFKLKADKISIFLKYTYMCLLSIGLKTFLSVLEKAKSIAALHSFLNKKWKKMYFSLFNNIL